ncbi:MFS general substrate transporter [Xylariomycetidae sp. FL2044]|nr:MFS general substrate transporter [Xylariomycetidae sp. FL2044]
MSVSQPGPSTPGSTASRDYAGIKTEPDSEDGPRVVRPVDQELLLFYALGRGKKIWISALASVAGMFSTLCSYIYYPALVPLAEDLGVSIALINLTITSYLVMAAVVPALMGDMADQRGRRPVYILMFSLFIGANVGIALQRSYVALFILRMLQSAGSSGLISVAYGVIADITTRKERGGYCAMFDLFQSVSRFLKTDRPGAVRRIQFALSIGPVIGGTVTQQLGWRWVFWFLSILTGSHFLIMLLFLPETQRDIVGGHEGKPRGVYWSLLLLTRNERTTATIGGIEQRVPKPKFHVPSPFASLRILGNQQSLAVIMLYSITYAVKMTLQASLGAQCVEIYHLDYLTAGLIYLPSGIGGALSASLAGRYLNKVYSANRGTEVTGSGDQSPEISIEETRLKGVYLLIIFTTLETVGYGLSLMTRAHISVMIIMQFLIGLTTSPIFTMSATLLTDLNENKSATAQGACSFIRCLGAAGAIAAMQPLADAVDLGWCFAIYAVLMASEVPIVWLICRRSRTRAPTLVRS